MRIDPLRSTASSFISWQLLGWNLFSASSLNFVVVRNLALGISHNVYELASSPKKSEKCRIAYTIYIKSHQGFEGCGLDERWEVFPVNGSHHLSQARQ